MKNMIRKNTIDPLLDGVKTEGFREATTREFARKKRRNIGILALLFPLFNLTLLLLLQGFGFRPLSGVYRFGQPSTLYYIFRDRLFSFNCLCFLFGFIYCRSVITHLVSTGSNYPPPGPRIELTMTVSAN